MRLVLPALVLTTASLACTAHVETGEPPASLDAPSPGLEPSTLRGTVDSNPYRRCSTGPTDSAPWNRAWRFDTPEKRASGAVRIIRTAYFGGDYVDEEGMAGALSVTPAEAEMTVTGTVALTDFITRVNTWSLYARAGLGLRITVLNGTTVLCQNDEIIHDQYMTGGVEGAPITRTVSCNFLKDANIRNLTVDVALRGWVTAFGGDSFAHVEASGNVTGITSSSCVEYLALTNHEGACIEPAGATAADHSVRSSECDGGTNQRWVFDTENRIHSLGDLTLCLSQTAGFWPILRPCDASLEQQWTRSGMQLANNSLPGKCLQSYSMNSLLGFGNCNPLVAEQSFRFQ